MTKIGKTRANGAGCTRHRAGGSTAGLLGVLAMVGGLAAAAVVISPRIGRGATGELERAAEASPEQRVVLDSIATIVGQSSAVLAVHDRGATPFVEILLWLHDGENRGAVDPQEIGLLSHSRMLRSITFHDLEQGAAVPSIAVADVTSAAFCEAWRADPGIRRRVVATGISDALIRREAGSGGGGDALRISLTWGSLSTDSPQQASVLVDIVAPWIGVEE